MRVTPGARHPGVGGRRGDALIVRVAAQAVGGAANRAVIQAVAKSFGVPKRAVTLLHGASGRSKLLEVDVDAELGRQRLDELLRAG